MNGAYEHKVLSIECNLCGVKFQALARSEAALDKLCPSCFEKKEKVKLP